MKPLLLLLVVVAFLSPVSAQKMKSAFTGYDLKGWVEPEGNIWWTADNGILMAESDPSQQGSILWTKKKYKDFVVQLDFKMGKGTVDSGVFLRAESPQIQIGESGSLKRDMTCSPYVPGKGYPVEAAGVATLLKTEGWNTMRIEMRGQTATVWLNGEEVMTYTAETDIAKGPIGLQLHPKRDMSIEFRNIEVGKL
ncbi:MAG: DUF1080 domain-containing protein [Bacteroidota bacterium]